MADTLRPVGRTRLYEQVIARLQEHVAQSGLTSGSRLPPERELAARLGVSRASVAQAIVALEVQGLVETRHGGGIYLVRDRLEVDSLPDLVARKKRLPDVLDARDALETKLAALAAARHTEDDLAAIDAALVFMQGQIDRDEVPIEGDRRFHKAVTAAAHSQLLEAFYEEIRDAIAESRRESLRQPDRPRQSYADHARIAAAIRAGDGQAAAEAMHRHVDHVSTVRLLSWEPDEED
ncbi:MAG TPA: FadR/GntR family transcriptional regulator [Flexivirga sp.]|uniref:FadR/GntR family transcriptional regulator n=1 Tax=Flexivirga sp. TaxID=1962927 RepID=UPI002C5932BF|nr:FadR/GntR family transcriptional regulator [Flexivirga sp.]HWC24038.1 FadR/GntR family transcriptional regulator [Flexivirga sp.]